MVLISIFALIFAIPKVFEVSHVSFRLLVLSDEKLTSSFSEDRPRTVTHDFAVGFQLSYATYHNERDKMTEAKPNREEKWSETAKCWYFRDLLVSFLQSNSISSSFSCT